MISRKNLFVGILTIVLTQFASMGYLSYNIGAKVTNQDDRISALEKHDDKLELHIARFEDGQQQKWEQTTTNVAALSGDVKSFWSYLNRKRQ